MRCSHRPHVLCLALVAWFVRSAEGAPREVAGAVEVLWPKPAADGGTLVGRTTVGGAAAETTVEIRQILNQEGRAAAALGSLLTMARSVLAAHARSAPPDLTLETGAGGAFRVRSVPPGLYAVRAPRLGGRSTTVVVGLAESGSGTRADVEVVKGAQTLRGRILGPDGAPRKAIVALQPALQGARTGTVTLTDMAITPDGTFTWSGLPSGEYELDVSDPADGSLRVLSLALPGTRDLVLRTGPVVTLKGRVVDAAGAPVARPNLRLFQTTPYEQAQRAVFELAEATGEQDGTFTWPCPFHPDAIVATAPGRGRVTLAVDDPVRKEIYRRFQAQMEAEVARDGRWRAEDEEDDEESAETARRWGRTSRDEHPQPEPPNVMGVLELRLQAPGRIAGRVLDGGMGVAGVRVLSISLGGLGFDPTSLLETSMCSVVSANDGSFALDDVNPGRHLVVASGAGWCSAPIAGPESSSPLPGLGLPDGIRVEAGGSAAVDLPVVRTGSFSGRVVDGAGRPVVDALVSLVAVPGGNQPVGLRLLASLDEAAGAVSGADGRFRFAGVPPDVQHRLASVGPDGALGFSGGVAVSGGGVREIDLALEPPVFANLRVVFEGSDQPVEGARVAVGIQGQAVLPALARRYWSTGADGRARIGPLPAEGVTLSVRDAEFRLGGGTVVEVPPVEGPSRVVDVVARLKPPGRAAGRIVGPAGAPLASTRLAFLPPEPGEWDALALGRSLRSQKVGADGLFEAESDTGGRYRLVASLPWNGELYEAVRVTDVPVKGLELRLVPLQPGGGDARVLVRVRDVAGRLVPRARFRVLGRDARARSFEMLGSDRSASIREGVGLADPRGGLRLSGTEPTSLFVEVWRARDVKGPLPLGAVRVGPLPVGGGVHEIRLPPERRLTVRVLNAQGKGVADAQVDALFAREGAADAEPSRPTLGGPTLASEDTDAQGTAVLTRLGPAPVLVVVTPPTGFVLPATELVPAERSTLEVRLVPERLALVTVVDGDGRPVKDVGLSVYPHRPPTAGPRREGSEDPIPEQAKKPGEVDRIFRSGEQEVFQGTTDAQGLVQARGIRAGAIYDLVARPEFDRDDLEATEVSPWDGNDVRVVLGRAAGVRVRVRRKDGQPAGAFALWTHRFGTWSEESRLTVQPDATLFVRALGTQPLWLLATNPGRHPPSSPQAQAAWEQRAVRRLPSDPGVADLVLDEGVALQVTARGMGDGVSLGAWLWPDPKEGPPPPAPGRFKLPDLLGRDEEQSPGTTARQGTFRWTGLDPDELYILRVASDDGFVAVRRGVRAGALQLALALTAEMGILGRIVPPPKEGQEAHVEYAEPGLTGRQPVKSDGTFGLGGLPAGRWRLRAAIREKGRVVRERVFVVTGPDAGDIELLEGSLDEHVAALNDPFSLKDEPEKRREHMDRALAIDPSQPQAAILRARAREEAGDLEGAGRDLENVLSVWPHHSHALRARASIRWRARDRVGSVADAEHALERDDGAEDRYWLAWTYARSYDLTAARRHVQRALELLPDFARARALQVDIVRLGGDVKSAQADAETALHDFPGDPTVQIAWCDALRRAGRSAEVLSRLAAWIEAVRDRKDTKHVDLLIWQRVLAQLETDAPQAGEADFAEKARTDDGWAAVMLWVARARAGRLPSATEVAASRLDDRAGPALDRRARRILEHLTGRRSADDLVKSVEPLGADPFSRADALWSLTEAWFYVAERRRADGDTAGAIAAYREAIAANAGDPAEHTLALNALAALEAAGAAPAGGR